MKGNINNSVRFAFSSRSYGPLNRLGHSYFDHERDADRAQFLQLELGKSKKTSIQARLKHGGKVVVVEFGPDDENWIEECDALVTGRKNLVLCVAGADCPSVVFYDPIKEVLAVAHSGWKPLVHNIILNTVGKMMKEFGCDPKSIVVRIGPGVCMDHYEVKMDVASRFPKSVWNVSADGKIYLNLKHAILDQLREAGVPSLNVECSDECTFHTMKDGVYKYYSYRRDHENPVNCGIMAAVME